LDCLRANSDVTVSAAIVKPTSRLRTLWKVGTRLAVVVAVGAALNVSVAYAGEYCSDEPSSSPSDSSNSQPGDPNNNDGYMVGNGSNWSYQDQNDHGATVLLTVSGG
jgi:hypothetical protein